MLSNPRHDAAGVTAVPRYGSLVSRRHDAVNVRMMLKLITLAQDDSWLWYHHDSAFAIAMIHDAVRITMMLPASW